MITNMDTRDLLKTQTRSFLKNAIIENIEEPEDQVWFTIDELDELLDVTGYARHDLEFALDDPEFVKNSDGSFTYFTRSKYKDSELPKLPNLVIKFIDSPNNKIWFTFDELYFGTRISKFELISILEKPEFIMRCKDNLRYYTIRKYSNTALPEEPPDMIYDYEKKKYEQYDPEKHDPYENNVISHAWVMENFRKPTQKEQSQLTDDGNPNTEGKMSFAKMIDIEPLVINALVQAASETKKILPRSNHKISASSNNIEERMLRVGHFTTCLRRKFQHVGDVGIASNVLNMITDKTNWYDILELDHNNKLNFLNVEVLTPLGKLQVTYSVLKNWIEKAKNKVIDLKSSIENSIQEMELTLSQMTTTIEDAIGINQDTDKVLQDLANIVEKI